jgi:hypothetical protein
MVVTQGDDPQNTVFERASGPSHGDIFHLQRCKSRKRPWWRQPVNNLLGGQAQLDQDPVASLCGDDYN